MKLVDRSAIRLIAAITLLGVLMTACAAGESGGDKLTFKQVELTSDPAAPVAKQETKLTVQIHNKAYAAEEAEVQLQINATNSLPKLLDMKREGETYTLVYAFPSAGDYALTIHMSYEEDHFSFRKELKINA